MEEMLHDTLDHLPRSFFIVFPATIELAESSGLELKLSDHMNSIVSYISNTRQQIIRKEEMVDKWQYPPLLAYLETFQFTMHNVDQQTIVKHLSEDGSLFQSPSATAQAYISTRNHKCLEYLMSLVHKCPNGGVVSKSSGCTWVGGGCGGWQQQCSVVREGGVDFEWEIGSG
ncbi:hypothetical protein Tco_0783361 [Tanacetum coccineum]